jgi:hypothetical protein
MIQGWSEQPCSHPAATGGLSLSAAQRGHGATRQRLLCSRARTAWWCESAWPGQELIQQAATNTTISDNVFQHARSKTTSTSTSTSPSDITGWSRELFVIGIKYSIPSLGTCLTSLSAAFRSRLATSEHTRLIISIVTTDFAP